MNSINTSIIKLALDEINKQFARGAKIESPETASDFLKLNLATESDECFAVMFLDSKNRVQEFRIMFRGSVNYCNIYLRSIAKSALELNSSAVILSHNHPSGDPKPSDADIQLTKTIERGLAIFDIKVLDHIIVGNSCASMRELLEW